MFFNKKKKHRQDKISKLNTLTLPVLIRQIIYDSMLMPAEDIAREMGLPPVSDEVAEMEEEASQDRISRFSRLIPFIDSHADIMARIATAAYLLDEQEDDSIIDTSDTDAMTRMFRLVALSATISCMSTLFSLELIESEVETSVEQ